MKSNVEQLKIAESYLGRKCTDALKYCGLASSLPWCNAFVTYIFYRAGSRSLYCDGAKEVYCPHSIEWCYNNLANIPPYLAMPSDIIYFDWNANGVPDHIGFVRERVSDQAVRTLEGNTDGGVVAYKTRNCKYVLAVFRPHFKASYKDAELEIDGAFGYNSIAMLQKALGITVDGILGKGTVKALQKMVGVTQDGSWGTKTSKAVQEMVGTTADGYFGVNSVKALQTWINKQNKKKSNGDKLGAKADELAYPTDTSEAKYPSGKPTVAYKAALDKAYPNRSSWGKAPKAGASCDVFVGTCIRSAGIDSDFPRGLAEQIPYLAKSSKFSCVISTSSRNVKSSELMDGDIIVCLYSRKTGGGHIWIYYAGKAKHASVNQFYPKTTSIGSRLNIKGKKWIKVYRAK